MAILTLTLNPAIDLETRTDHVLPGEKLRCDEPTRDPGGGGINVARAVIQLGGTATALIAAGGPAGAALDEMLAERGVPSERVPAPGETRQNLSVIEGASGKQFRFIFPGPAWSASDFDAVAAALVERVAPDDWVVLSGSLPPGATADQQVDLVRALAGQGARVVADTSGPGLVALSGARSGLCVLRLDHEESERLAGRALPRREDSVAFARHLVDDGAAEIAILARGAEGSVLASAEGHWAAPAADVQIVSRTGAGDSFVAAAVLALSRGQPLPEVLSLGCAAASAAVTTAATELCTLEKVEELLPQTVAQAI